MTRLALYLTGACNLDRGICHDWINCSPSRIDNIYKEAFDYIASAKKVGLDTISFSGGEPTLDMVNLLALIMYAKSLGLYTTLKTNAWWGDAKNAEQYVSDLYSAGLDWLRISYDTNWIYPGSPILKENTLRAIALGWYYFSTDRRMTVLYPKGEIDANYFQTSVKVNGANIATETIPVLDSAKRLNETVTSFDPTSSKMVTQQMSLAFRPTIDSKKRFFTNSEGICEAEYLGTLTDRYVGSLDKNTFEELYVVYQTMVNK